MRIDITPGVITGYVPDPVAQGILLEEFFSKVLEVPLGEGNVGGHSNLLVT